MGARLSPLFATHALLVLCAEAGGAHMRAQAAEPLSARHALKETARWRPAPRAPRAGWRSLVHGVDRLSEEDSSDDASEF